MLDVSPAAEKAEKPLKRTQKASGHSMPVVRQEPPFPASEPEEPAPGQQAVRGKEPVGSVSDKRWLEWKAAYANRRSAIYLLVTLGRNLRIQSEDILRKKVS
jgi:hypothetical protein